MQNQLSKILEEAKERLASAVSVDDTEEIRVRMLGKKGQMTEVLRSMKDMAPEDRKTFGQEANQVRAQIESMLRDKMEEMRAKAQNMKFEAERIDVTEPGRKTALGSKHPITITIDEISKIFMSMGFSIAEGPEVETVFYNFDALNAGPNHPARDMTDTFYFNEELLLRTQTSPVQIRTMRSQELPIKIISPGRCFRNDSLDATHSPMFHQIEGLVVGKDITMAQFKGTVETFVKKLFGENTKTKFRPHNFPFTEPSAEVDVSCFKCGGKGCPMCKGEGWIEILGSGMVHPNVLRNCGIDPEVYSGFAFGMGVERLAMLKYEIDDIRLLVENDMRFLDQF